MLEIRLQVGIGIVSYVAYCFGCFSLPLFLCCSSLQELMHEVEGLRAGGVFGMLLPGFEPQSLHGIAGQITTVVAHVQSTCC